MSTTNMKGASKNSDFIVKASNQGNPPCRSAQFLIEAGGQAPEVTITSDALLDKQVIQFSADL